MNEHSTGDDQPTSIPRLDGGAMQRRRRGLASTSQGDASVLPFPSRDRTAVRSTESEGSLCGTGADDSESSTTRTHAGATRPRNADRSPKRTRRGPNPIGVLMPSLALPKNLSGYRPQDVGLVTHAAVAILAPHAQTMTPIELPERVLDVCGSLVNGHNVNRRRVLMLTAAGHVATYFRRYSPTSPWSLLGCEFDTTGGRTDVAWQHTETGQVFFDELKTHNRPITALASETVAQAKRQAEGGDRLYGEQFAGVRVIPLGSLHVTSLIVTSLPRVLLHPTPAEPLRMAADPHGGGLR